MNEQFPPGQPRPTEADFQRVVEEFREKFRLSRQHGINMYDSAKRDIESWAEGGGDQELREQYYPGWTNEDFRILLEKLDAMEKEV